jgi:hypothetical protein
VKTTPETTVEFQVVKKAYGMLAAEVGHLMAASTLYEQILAIEGFGGGRLFDEKYGRSLPVLSSLIEAGKSPELVQRHIKAIIDRTVFCLADKEHIICAGMEATFLDYVTNLYPDKIFYVVPHDHSVDIERALSNYPNNVRICEGVNLWPLSGALSVIIVFAFGLGFETFHTYPIVCRIIGSDIRQRFAEILALDVLGCNLSYYQEDFVEIPFGEVTKIITNTQHQHRLEEVKWTTRRSAYSRLSLAL